MLFCMSDDEKRVGRDRRARRSLAVIALIACSISRADDLLPPMTQGIPAEFAPRRAGAEVGADRRIFVSREGLYRITASALVAAGISNPIGSQIRLYCRTQEIALAVTSDGLWTTNDFAVFYGWPHDGYWTQTNVYWLGIGGSGLRMTQRNAAPQPGWPERTTHRALVRYEPDQLFIPTYRPQDATFNHWVAHLLTNAFVQVVTAATPDRVLADSGALSVRFWGRSATNHATRVSINSGLVQTSFYAGQVSYTTNLSFTPSVLSNGTNIIRFEQLLGAVDSAWLDSFELRYTASNRVSAGLLVFDGTPISNNYAAAPWNTNEVPWLLDITKPDRPVRLINFAVETDAGTGVVRWADFAFETNRFWLAAPTTLIDVVVSPSVQFRDFTNTARRADYLILTHSSLSTGAYHLAKHRARDGLRTLMVPIESVYDEFSYGIKDARAIKQFLGYAFHHWTSPPPKYVLLFGDGSHDPQNHYGLSQPLDLLPLWMGPAPYDFSAQDGYLATVEGSDYLRDIQIGRLPLTTHAQTTAAVARIIGYESASTGSSWRTRALLAADVNSAYPSDFQTASDTYILSNLVKAGITSIWKAYETGTNTATTRAMITNAINGVINTGPVFSVSYFGHGASYLWNAGAFSTSHVMTLNNSIWPVVSVFSCDNGDFSNPRSQSMAESFLLRPMRGATATFSASGLSVQEAAKRIADGFFRHLSNAPPKKRLGDMIDEGLVELYGFSTNSGELLFYNLLGDPAQVVRP